MKLPFDNLALKAASVALAALLWYVIAGEKTSEMGLTVPVELQNFPRALELTGEPVNAVEVRLRASPGMIQRIVPGEVSAQVNLAGVGEGEHIVHLTGEAIRVPFGVRVVRVNPSTISLSFERTLQKTVPVRPRLTGRPAPGHEVAEVTASPAEVQVIGPKSRVNDVESAYTEPISVDGARSDVVERVAIGIEDPLLRIQGTPRVEVTARVREVHDTRTLEALPIVIRGADGTLRPGQVRVVLSGPADALARVDASQVRPYVETTRARAGQPIPVAVELAPGLAGISVKEWQPAQVAWRPGRARR
ncbi:MAG TPA: CdaR family protein [Methylomirabilota bacterium]|nr:CdaR family protein [Methylomirabilota bacterium]